ncbi:SDR family NAD(P)-dependent oxidoreductase [Aquitalea sp. S1-19]|nr:SDR family NAD(P)-dependent oxidoreductase [Aquitalea sp. S1-19]MCP9760904.1 SDR family NAD(P)-dependent oxidoreductase [Aquitalea sp. S1-19]
MRHGILLTGASRGLGAALARTLATKDSDLVCIARQSDETLTLPEGARLAWVQADLADSALLELVAERALAALGTGPFATLTLINNAGTVAPIAPCGHYPQGGVEHALALNTLAPMLLCNAFLAWAAGRGAQVRILNISSGAAASAIAGWSVYGASKAALDHFSRCVAAEQASLPDGARVVSLYPGVKDGLALLKVLRLPLVVITNKSERLAVPLLELLELGDLFSLVIGGDTLSEKKPSAMPLQHTAMVLNLKTEEIAMVGDSINDILSARAAGSPAIAVSYGYADAANLGADIVLDSLAELYDLMKNG